MRDDDERGVNKDHHPGLNHHPDICTRTDGCEKDIHHQHAGLKCTVEIFKLVVEHIGHQQGQGSDEQDAVIGDIKGSSNAISDGADGQADRQCKADMYWVKWDHFVISCKLIMHRRVGVFDDRRRNPPSQNGHRRDQHDNKNMQGADDIVGRKGCG